MKPTPKLRFVEREQAIGQMITHRKILQQWWADFVGPLELDGEWRDVPIEQEESNETT